MHIVRYIRPPFCTLLIKGGLLLQIPALAIQLCGCVDAAKLATLAGVVAHAHQRPWMRLAHGLLMVQRRHCSKQLLGCVYIYMKYIDINRCIYICKHMYINICTYSNTCTYICICINEYIHTNIYKYMCIICIHVSSA